MQQKSSLTSPGILLHASLTNSGMRTSHTARFACIVSTVGSLAFVTDDAFVAAVEADVVDAAALEVVEAIADVDEADIYIMCYVNVFRYIIIIFFFFF
jgi:hypothetical protein